MEKKEIEYEHVATTQRLPYELEGRVTARLQPPDGTGWVLEKVDTYVVYENHLVAVCVWERVKTHET